MREQAASGFLAEVFEQGLVLARCLAYYREQEAALRREVRRRAGGRIVFTGMGASLYACVPAICFLQQRAEAAQAVETAELLYYGLRTLSARDSLVVVSQSGETAELRRLLDELPKPRPRLLAITNEPKSSLGRRADVVLPLRAGPQNFASSKTYSASVLVALLLAAFWMEGSLRRLLHGLAKNLGRYRRLLNQAGSQAGALAKNFKRSGATVLLARGPSLASALAGALLFKEVCALPAEGMSAAQFRHGPLELLCRPLAAILFSSPGASLRLNRSLGHDLLRQGARLLWVSSAGSGLRGSQAFRLPRVSVPELLPLFEIAPLQFLTAALAEQAGREPGRLCIARNVTLTE